MCRTYSTGADDKVGLFYVGEQHHARQGRMKDHPEPNKDKTAKTLYEGGEDVGELEVSSSGLRMKLEFPGKGFCPHDPRHNSTAIFAGKFKYT